jgi:phosphatidylglycerophosphatase A
MRFFNYLVATGLGLGYTPVAPGTAGSLLGLVLMYFLSSLSIWLVLLIIIGLFFLGVYTGRALEKRHGTDPQLVVIDEVVGMMVSLLTVPRIWWLYIGGFVMFRVFDILKPPPADTSERLKGGWGIMLDDVVSGVYALIVVRLFILYFFPI